MLIVVDCCWLLLMLLIVDCRLYIAEMVNCCWYCGLLLIGTSAPALITILFFSRHYCCKESTTTTKKRFRLLIVELVNCWGSVQSLFRVISLPQLCNRIVIAWWPWRIATSLRSVCTALIFCFFYSCCRFLCNRVILRKQEYNHAGADVPKRDLCICACGCLQPHGVLRACMFGINGKSCAS